MLPGQRRRLRPLLPEERRASRARPTRAPWVPSARAASCLSSSRPPVRSSCCRATSTPNRGRQLGRGRAGPLPQTSTWRLSPAANAASNLTAANRTSSHGLTAQNGTPPGRSRSTKGQAIPVGCPDQNDHVRRRRCRRHGPGQRGVLRQRASASGSGRGSSSRSRVKVRPSARGMGSLPVPYLWVCAAM